MNDETRPQMLTGLRPGARRDAERCGKAGGGADRRVHRDPLRADGCPRPHLSYRKGSF